MSDDFPATSTRELAEAARAAGVLLGMEAIAVGFLALWVRDLVGRAGA